MNTSLVHFYHLFDLCSFGASLGVSKINHLRPSAAVIRHDKGSLPFSIGKTSANAGRSIVQVAWQIWLSPPGFLLQIYPATIEIYEFAYECTYVWINYVYVFISLPCTFKHQGYLGVTYILGVHLSAINYVLCLYVTIFLFTHQGYPPNHNPTWQPRAPHHLGQYEGANRCAWLNHRCQREGEGEQLRHHLLQGPWRLGYTVWVGSR